jgi:hypothetical protein
MRLKRRPLRDSLFLLPLLAFAFANGLRAQVTEVPQTIAPGQLLVRADAFSFGLRPDTPAPNQYQALALGSTLLSTGITQDLDVEAGAQLYLRETFAAGGRDTTQSGVGDVSMRLKWAFWKDPSIGQAAALIPFVLVPTNSSVEGTSSASGGLIIPWSLTTSWGPTIGAMVEWNELRNAANTGYDSGLYGTVYSGINLSRRIGIYGEVTGNASTAGSTSDTGTAGGGGTLRLTNDFLLDYEISRVLGPGRNDWTQALRFRWKLN